MHTLFRSAALLLLALLAACAPALPAPTPVPGPYGLGEPFLGAWRAAGAEQVGGPRTEPLWVDEYQVQLFDRLLVTAVDATRAVAEPLAPGWEANYPADLLALPPSPLRVSLGLAAGQPTLAQPLSPLTATLRAPGYSGPAELRLYDSALRPAGQLAVEVRNGQGEIALLPRGRLGPQWALALIDGQLAGARSALFKLDAETALQTGQPGLDGLYPRLRGFLERGVVSYTLNGQPVRGYRSPDNPLLWLRDHVYQGRGFRYFERDTHSLLDAFRAAQRPDGSFPDVIDYPERFVSAFRKEVEADLEFLFVQGVYEAWQSSGDDEWLRQNLAAMRQAVAYSTSDPVRWNSERGLMRRPYTIDMWDFAYGPTTTSPDGKPAPRHWIRPETLFGTFHGDNTGLAHALRLLARVEERVGDPTRAATYREQAKAIMARLNELSWNGRFFAHFVPEDQSFQPVGVDPAAQLSLSNAYALNRDVLDQRQGQAIVEEYFARRDFGRAFAEWYSIDPPFPAGSYGMAGGKGEQPGEYVNGGVMPLVGGELARGAFRYGLEPYGLDILQRYAALTELTGATYLWYYPDGRPGISGPDTLDSDGWGAAAMLGALFEGAAGIVDGGSRYSDLLLSPRWVADPALREVRVVARYGASDGYAAYHWQRDERGLQLSLTSSAESVYLRLMLPKEAPKDPAALRVTLDGASVPTAIDRGGETSYLALQIPGGQAEVVVEW